mgnify:CR=1 FL=1
MSEPRFSLGRGYANNGSRFLRTFSVATVVLVLVVTALLMPVPIRGPQASPLADLAHAPVFAVLACLALLLLSHLAPQHSISDLVSLFSRTRFRVLSVAIGLTLFGIAMEYTQRFFGRSGEWGDVFLNSLGLSAGIFFFWALQSRRYALGKLFTSLCLVFVVGLLLFASARPVLELWLIYRSSGGPQ